MVSFKVSSVSIYLGNCLKLFLVIYSLLHSTNSYSASPLFNGNAISNVTASNTCTIDGNGFTCNNTCPTRTSLPSYIDVFQNVPASSPSCNNTIPSSPELPSSAVTPNGKIQFTENTANCTEFTESNPTGQTSFTLAMWVHVTCDQCEILQIGSTVKINVSSTTIQMGDAKTSIDKSIWHHMALRFSGSLSWYVDGKHVITTTSSIGATENMIFGPQDNLTSGEIIAFADGRMYTAPLTDREIQSLNSGQLLVLPSESDCRCPDNYPFLVENTVPEKYLKCTNSGNSTKVPRLNSDAHPAIYMADNDNDTYWNSGSVNEATVTLTLGTIFQLSKLTLTGLQTIPDEIILRLKSGSNTNMELLFKSDCGSTSDCIQYAADMGSTSSFTYNFERDMMNRTSVEKIVANEVLVTLKSGSQRFLTVSEVQLFVRCHCFGNDATCVINGHSYTCSCAPDSHTTGQHCDACVDEYFRNELDDLTCTLPCNCNSKGSQNNKCNKLGGQCPCKPNVDPNANRMCTTCKHNSADFGGHPTDGCKSCSCTANGITRCENDLTCTCKANVETTSGQCSACNHNFYNITDSDGCVPCNCVYDGSTSGRCDKTTGQCPCRVHVEGRTCDRCKGGYYDLRNTWQTGCIDCECNFVGSTNPVCAKDSGQCTCIVSQVGDRKCTPEIIDIVPLYGPLAGGTEISIKGHLLGASTVRFTFSVNDEHQTTKSRNESLIVVTSSPSSSSGSFSIALAWSDEDKIHQGTHKVNKFEYKENPVITLPRVNFKTYASGGCSIDITGNYLSSVYQPKLMIYNEDETEDLKSVCSHVSDNSMTCKTPNVTSYVTSGSLSYGFWLDNVKDYTKVDNQTTNIEVFDDPEIATGKSITFKNMFDNEIKISGKNLQNACDERDVRVTIGGEDCPIEERTSDYIICSPSDKFPGKNSEQELKVHIGNLVLVHGTVNFKAFWGLPEFIGIATGVGLLVVGLIAIFIICKCRRKGTFNKPETNEAFELRAKDEPRGNDYTKWDVNQPANQESTNMANGTQPKPDYKKSFLERLERSVRKVVENSMIERSHIEPGQHCTHKGTKIRVISGRFSTGVSNQYAGTAVTMKTLVSSYSETDPLPQWLNDGLNESTRLQNLVHDNVLRLLGITIDSKSVYILYPEMSKRTLKDYLLTAKSPFPNSQKLDLSVQVAEGMEYMSSSGLVHRDLAARNCWVSNDDIVKIADTSFTYDLYPDEYLFQNGKHQPVRWLAPESLRQAGFYTSKSDVWSFGVLMWEIFTNGYLPYPDITDNASIRDYVCEKGYRLGQPHDCPDNTYSVIEECHADYSDSRPTFYEVLNKITMIISPNDGGGDHLYQNQKDLSEYRDPEADMELYENTLVGKVRQSAGMPQFPAPPVPPKKSSNY